MVAYTGDEFCTDRKPMLAQVFGGVPAGPHFFFFSAGGSFAGLPVRTWST